MFMRDVEDVIREIVVETRFKGHQDYRFEAELDENRKRRDDFYGGGKCRCFLSDLTDQVYLIYVPDL